MVRQRDMGWSVESWLVSAGRSGAPGAPLNTPLVPASNFILGGDRGYSREDGTPTTGALEELLGGLESGLAVAFSSGMAAVAAVFDQLAVGSIVALPDGCYQGVTALAEAGRRAGRWEVRCLRVEDTAGWIETLSSADLAWLESPSNPLLVVADLEAICGAERKPGSILVVDNTFATPLNQQPLVLGADVSMQSATKFIGGHSDLLAGVLVTRSAGLHSRFLEARALTGANPGALESYLAVRGARTLALRVERAQRSASLIAGRLVDHPAVELVRYPGLPSHPTHGLAAAQLKGFGSVLSFDVSGGAAAAERADEVCRKIRLIHHATSLGAVESTMERRSVQPGQEHLPPGLLRLSVGIEEVEDLWSDLARGLA